ncbi:methylmalonic aciduria and homocystinuria type D homolog, mitochondrial isoform X2 [Thrips palmi]|nr:methylmalonic aciduria and homocystinuria type D homolog, mitochondrial isoform X2 [Thrips palmi]XP_034254425.1 methylmalonic aciduria and homocystinuria type D homolog, mitochondrial isoform X2 [Thrips palmi]XP_034254426.1 methylmalonic aciduria and homocystinuria type D homolog, mitochondrial isoform X2 [Thrips palmi]
MLCSQRLLSRNVVRSVNVTLQALYSGKRNSDNGQEGQDVYNLVPYSVESDVAVNNSNWELLAQRYRLYMPGKLGHAWLDNSSTAHLEYSKSFQNTKGGSMEYSAQECPLLLRAGLMEMFPGLDFRQQNTTIISLRQPLYRRGRRQDIDELTKLFLLAAQKICGQLMDMGYWADFINPFSGRPYFYYKVPRDVLYKTDKRFHCMGFNINNKANCKVISLSVEANRYMVGSLFTSAPPLEAIAPLVKEAEEKSHRD